MSMTGAYFASTVGDQAGGGVEVPNTISGLDFWLDPKDQSTVQLDGSGNAEVVTDKSGNGFDFFCNTSSQRPGYNSSDGLIFSGNQFLESAYTYMSSVSVVATFFIFWKPYNVTDPQYLAHSDGTESSTTSQSFSLLMINDNFIDIMIGGYRNGNQHPVSVNENILLSIAFSKPGTSGISRKNQNQVGLGVGSVSSAFPLVLGRRGPNNVFYNGEIKEVLNYNRILSGAEILEIESYLNNKHLP